jgi:hypothetical protein
MGIAPLEKGKLMKFKKQLLLFSLFLFAVPAVSKADLIEAIVNLSVEQARTDIQAGEKLNQVYSTWGKNQTPLGFALYMAQRFSANADKYLEIALVLLEGGTDLNFVQNNPGDSWIFVEEWGGRSLIERSPGLIKAFQDRGYFTKKP